jgi:hypothetical protein
MTSNSNTVMPHYERSPEGKWGLIYCLRTSRSMIIENLIILWFNKLKLQGIENRNSGEGSASLMLQKI